MSKDQRFRVLRLMAAVAVFLPLFVSGCALAPISVAVRSNESGGFTNPLTQYVQDVVETSSINLRAESGDSDEGDDGGEGRGFFGTVIHQVIFYIPNRVFDLVDVVRLRVRVGPGAAGLLRLTTAADLFLGSYISAWAGLPGPRLAKGIPIPFGMESRNGAALSFLKLTAQGSLGPEYSWSELVIGGHLILIGLDVGIDPVEIADFATGLIFIDIRGDDF